MSDCSTEAMKVKRKPVEIKVVSGFASKALVITRDGKRLAVPAQVVPRKERDGNELCRFLIGADRFDDLLSPSEQRCQQLEQVALDMFYDLDPYNAVSHVEKLRELGVSLDD